MLSQITNTPIEDSKNRPYHKLTIEDPRKVVQIQESGYPEHIDEFIETIVVPALIAYGYHPDNVYARFGMTEEEAPSENPMDGL